jgi:hypothetical protein
MVVEDRGEKHMQRTKEMGAKGEDESMDPYA